MAASSRIDDAIPASLAEQGLVGDTPPVLPASALPVVNGPPVLRTTDSEYKILNAIANQLGDNTQVTGSITLMSELPPCASCSGAIEAFKVKYPNITVNVIPHS